MNVRCMNPDDGSDYDFYHTQDQPNDHLYEQRIIEEGKSHRNLAHISIQSLRNSIDAFDDFFHKGLMISASHQGTQSNTPRFNKDVQDHFDYQQHNTLGQSRGNQHYISSESFCFKQPQTASGSQTSRQNRQVYNNHCFGMQDPSENDRHTASIELQQEYEEQLVEEGSQQINSYHLNQRKKKRPKGQQTTAMSFLNPQLNNLAQLTNNNKLLDNSNPYHNNNNNNQKHQPQLKYFNKTYNNRLTLRNFKPSSSQASKHSLTEPSQDESDEELTKTGFKFSEMNLDYQERQRLSRLNSYLTKTGIPKKKVECVDNQQLNSTQNRLASSSNRSLLDKGNVQNRPRRSHSQGPSKLVDDLQSANASNLMPQNSGNNVKNKAKRVRQPAHSLNQNSVYQIKTTPDALQSDDSAANLNPLSTSSNQVINFEKYNFDTSVVNGRLSSAPHITKRVFRKINSNEHSTAIQAMSSKLSSKKESLGLLPDSRISLLDDSNSKQLSVSPASGIPASTLKQQSFLSQIQKENRGRPTQQAYSSTGSANKNVVDSKSDESVSSLRNLHEQQYQSQMDKFAFQEFQRPKSNQAPKRSFLRAQSAGMQNQFKQTPQAATILGKQVEQNNYLTPTSSATSVDRIGRLTLTYLSDKYTQPKLNPVRTQNSESTSNTEKTDLAIRGTSSAGQQNQVHRGSLKGQRQAAIAAIASNGVLHSQNMKSSHGFVVHTQQQGSLKKKMLFTAARPLSIQHSDVFLPNQQGKIPKQNPLSSVLML